MNADYQRLFVNAVEWATLIGSEVFQVTTVSPNSGGNAGRVTVTIRGSAFREGAVVRLVEGNQVQGRTQS